MKTLQENVKDMHERLSEARPLCLQTMQGNEVIWEREGPVSEVVLFLMDRLKADGSPDIVAYEQETGRVVGCFGRRNGKFSVVLIPSYKEPNDAE